VDADVCGTPPPALPPPCCLRTARAPPTERRPAWRGASSTLPLP